MGASAFFLPSSLWRGIYDFPFRLSNVKVWMILTICAVLEAFIASGFTGLALVMASIPPGQELTGPTLIIYRGGIHISIGLCVFAFVFSWAPSAFFLATIEATAAGNDEVDWPDNVWYDYLGNVVFLIWIFGCCAAVTTVFWLLADLILPMPRILWWGVTIASAFLLFPIPLYSTMIAGSPWILIHPMFLIRLIQEPLASLALYLHTALLLFPCLALGLWMVATFSWLAAPVVGVIWSTCLLCYGRALGRIGYILAEDRKRVVRKKKRKKVRARRDAPE
jgi:hypothetical protein